MILGINSCLDHFPGTLILPTQNNAPVTFLGLPRPYLEGVDHAYTERNLGKLESS